MSEVLRRRPRLALAPAKPGPTYSRIKQAVRLFRNGYGPKSQRKANMRKWIDAVQRLGERWVYAKTIKLSKVKT